MVVPQLLFVPGTLLNHELWAAQEAAFGRKYDIKVTTEQTRYPTLSGMASAILDEAAPEFILVGLSLGASVAFDIVEKAPERVKRLVLIGASLDAQTGDQIDSRRLRIDSVRAGRFEEVKSSIIKHWIYSGHERYDQLLLKIDEIAEAVGADSFVKQNLAVIDEPDQRHRCSLIRCPLLVICGRQDQITPLSISQEICHLVPQTELVVIEKCGHLAPLERPTEVNAALRKWLAQT